MYNCVKEVQYIYILLFSGAVLFQLRSYNIIVFLTGQKERVGLTEFCAIYVHSIILIKNERI